MDWHSWLSKSSLEPSIIYEYGLVFSSNELEEEDIAHFDHEFLMSMGISIAKHRLEILKLAKKEKKKKKKKKSPRPMAKLVDVMNKTKKSLARYAGTLIHPKNSEIMVVPKGWHDDQWKGSMLKRNKRVVVVKQNRLMITDGEAKFAGFPSRSHSASPMVQNCYESSTGDDDAYWGSDAEAIRWDSMFQNLKPT
ncbi:uncharacterized protein [Elaeis guineensis]|uniref:Uncharacterized protein LOC105050101 n=1 Tax=Elaeis guineensis var. tenera TaxID=51953 RepID=A0A6I9RLJ4_ELAGV|nr:uncharacterized protein LOC105050101 [Elaeis guineensis]